MSTQARDSQVDLARGEYDALGVGRLTAIGLALAGVGWALLIGATATADLPAARQHLTASFHADLVDIAKCMVASGFALAVIGALQTGFGALNRFFEAVLMRSAQRVAPAEPVVAHQAPTAGNKRPYRLMPDGSVEVDTILGTRRFETMAEAREFI